MLYKVANGAVQEEHYGLALAKVVDLPPDVIRVAEEVSNKLTSNMEKAQEAFSNDSASQAKEAHSELTRAVDPSKRRKYAGQSAGYLDEETAG